MQLIKVSILIIFLSPFTSFSQKIKCGKNKREYQKIYATVLNSYFDSKKTTFVLINRTANHEIKETGYLDYTMQLPFMRLILEDSTWLNFLNEAELKKNELTESVLPRIKSIHKIILISRDSLNAVFKSEPIPWAGFKRKYANSNGWMEISDVIFSNKMNKAIVEISHTNGSLNGRGYLFFLKKDISGNWIIVYRIQTWVS